MIVVSDASPLIALAAINRLELLRDLYTELVIPFAVYDEVTAIRPTAPGAYDVREAKWIQVRPARNRALVEALRNALRWSYCPPAKPPSASSSAAMRWSVWRMVLSSPVSSLWPVPDLPTRVLIRILSPARPRPCRRLGRRSTRLDQRRPRSLSLGGLRRGRMVSRSDPGNFDALPDVCG